MRPRRWLALSVLVALLSVVAILPATPVGREWLLHFASDAVSDMGYSLGYRSSEGNPWLGVTLHGTTLRGQGVDLEVDRLSLGYFLPGLLTGELPISLDLQGLGGRVDVDQFDAPAGGGDLGIRVVLRELDVSEVDVEVGGVPWTLPELALEDVRIEQAQEALQFEGHVVTSEGTASVDGLLRSRPWQLEARILEADARLGRHWWNGVEGGVVQGRVLAEADSVVAELTVSAGELHFAGARAEMLNGPLHYENGVVRARLEGQALGGTIAGDVSVDVQDSHWEAVIEGEPGLQGLARWLSGSNEAAERLGLAGDAAVEVQASGWTEVRLEGRAAATGEVLGMELEGLRSQLSFNSGRGIEVTGDGRLGGGSLDFELQPRAGGQRLELNVQGASPLPEVWADLELSADVMAGEVEGSARTNFSGKVAGRDFRGEVDARLDGDGLQLFAQASDELGATAEGAAVLSGGLLEGQLQASDLRLAKASRPISGGLRADGPLQDLPLSLQLDGPGLKGPHFSGVRVYQDFAGEATANLRGGTLQDLKGQFGPLQLAGELQLAPLELRLGYDLSGLRARVESASLDTSAEGALGSSPQGAHGTHVDAAIASGSGSVSYVDSRLVLEGRFAETRLSAGELALGPLSLDVAAISGDHGYRFAFAAAAGFDPGAGLAELAQRDASLAGILDEEGLRLRLERPPLALSGDPLEVSGRLELGPHGALQASLLARAELIELTVAPAPEGNSMSLVALPGLELGPVALQERIEATGIVSGDLRQARISVDIAGQPWQTLLRAGDGPGVLKLLSGEGPDRFEFELDQSGEWRSEGVLELGPLGQALGIPLSGKVASGSRSEVGGYAGGLSSTGGKVYGGQLTSSGNAWGRPFELRAAGKGSGLALDGRLVAGVPWELSGALAPNLDLASALTLEATSRLGTLKLERGELTGAGVIPAGETAALRLGDLPWSLQGGLARQRLELKAAGNRAVLEWSDGPSLEARLQQAFQVAGVPGSLEASLDWHRGASGNVAGELVLAGQPLEIGGDLDRITATGRLDAGLLSEALLGQEVAGGTLGVTAELDPSDIDSAQAQWTLEADEARLAGSVRREGDAWLVTASGNGLEARYLAGDLVIQANEARLDPFLPPQLELLQLLTADGSLAREGDSWRGSLALRTMGQPGVAFTLEGAGEHLLADARLAGQDYEARVAGEVLPRLDLRLEATAFSAQADFSGSLTGSLGSPRLEAQIETSAMQAGPVLLSPVDLDVTGELAQLQVKGQGTSLLLTPSEISGSFEFPLQLASRQHILSGTVGGALARPQVRLELAGPLANGGGAWSGDRGQLALEVDPGPWLPQELHASGPVSAEFQANAQGHWSAVLESPARAAGQPLTVQAAIEGRGEDYQGEASLHLSGGRLLLARISGRGSSWQASVDLEDSQTEVLSTLLPGVSELQTTGTLTASGRPLEIEVDASLSGSAGTTPFRLGVVGDPRAQLTLVGEAAGYRLDGKLKSDGLRFELQESKGDDRLAGALYWEDDLVLDARGTVGGRELVAGGEFDPEERTGDLRANLGDSRFELSARPRGEGINVAIDSASGETFGWPFTARAQLLQSGGELLLESFEARSEVAGGLVTQLQGRLWPHSDVSGRLALEGGSGTAASLRIEAKELREPRLTLSTSGFSLAVERGASGWTTILEGSGDLPGGHRARADMSWSEQSGFSGEAMMTTVFDDGFTAESVLTGEGSLEVLSRLARGGTEFATARLSLGSRPWTDESLQGNVDVLARAQELLPAYTGEPLALAGEVTISGSLLEPRASGSLALAGAVEAELDVDYHEGLATVELAGPSANASLAVTPAAPGFELTGEVAGLDLSPLWPAAAGTSLTLDGSARNAGEEVRARLESFRLVRGGSVVAGSAELAESLEVEGYVDVDLSDLPLADVGLRGSVGGQLSLSAPSLAELLTATLRGSLKLEEGGIVGHDAMLSGVVEISGAARDPRLSAQLSGEGGAKGTLLLQAAPASREIALQSDLSLGQVATDLEVNMGGGAVIATGSIALPGGTLQVSSPASSPGTMLIDGSGRFQDWRLQLQTATLAGRLEADLASLGNGVNGRLELETAPPDSSGQWLRGRLVDLGWDGLSLGDVTLAALSPTSQIDLSGSALEATIEPAAGFAWRVERLALELPQQLHLRASGNGDLTGGSADLVLSGVVADQPAEIPLTLEFDRNDFQLSGKGSLLGGRLSLLARLEEESWSGELSATGLQLVGVNADLEGEIAGEAGRPQLTISGAASGEDISVDFSALLGPSRQVAEVSVSSEFLAQPLHASLVSEEATSVALWAGEQRVELSRQDGGNAVAAGELSVAVGPVRLTVAPQAADGAELLLLVELPHLPGLELAAAIDPEILLDLDSLLSTPLVLQGRGSTSGQLVVSPPDGALEVRDLAYRGAEFAVDLDGRVAPGLQGQLTGSLQLLSNLPGPLLPALTTPLELPISLTLQPDSFLLEGSSSLGALRAEYRLETSAGSISLNLPDLGSEVELAYTPGVGPRGKVVTTGLPLTTLADGTPLLLDAAIDVAPEEVSGRLELNSESGSLSANGTLGLATLLPQELAPRGNQKQRLALQLGQFDLHSLPWLQERLPYLDARVSGFLQVNDRQVVGRLTGPEVEVAGEILALNADLSGSLDELLLDTVIAGSSVRLTVDEQGITALATLERFPLHQLAEAMTGQLEASAEVTGAARLAIPWEGMEGLTVEVATEQVRLESGGEVTTGNVSLRLSNGELVVSEASFSGAGRWQASGQLARDALDFSLSAEDADFGPLLELVPLFAKYRVGAQGSLQMRAQGTMADPLITVQTPDLQFDVAGSSYRLEKGEAGLRGDTLQLRARVSGLEPVGGQLLLAGTGRLELLPLRLSEAVFSAQGSASLPWLGDVHDFEATLRSKPDVGLWLESRGSLGRPFSIEGSLSPLDLRMTGDDLTVRLPQLLLASAQVDADLRLSYDESFVVGGALAVDEARFELGIAPQRPSARRGPNPVAQQFVLDSVTIRAPGRVRFAENFGNAEMGLDLTLSGTAATPILTGNARVLRGTFQFSGRDFRIISGEARFDPSRGLLPALDIAAVTSFEMNRVLPSDGSVKFVAPQEGSRFEVFLTFAGEVEARPGESPPFRLDLEPSLRSEALIQEVRRDGLTSGPRQLTEAELLSIITLGRLELGAQLAGEGGLAAAVAEGAIDTAVDLLFVSELQAALAEALGLDVVEINTTALSTFLGGTSNDPFSVSLRLGGYLSDEVFASYRIGSFDDARGLYALTNEVNLLYELGPLELDLAGRVNFEDTRALSPQTELSASLRYSFDRLTSLEAGIDLADERQQIRFGVTLRW